MGRTRISAGWFSAIALILGASVLVATGDPASAGTTHGLRAFGRATYVDFEGTTRPIAGAKVEFCDDDFPFGDCELIAAGRTAADGTFDLTGSGGDIEGPPDVYVRVIAEGLAGVVRTEFLPFNYCMASPKLDNYDAIANGFDIDFGDLNPNNTRTCFPLGNAFADVDVEQTAWQLFDWLDDAFVFALGNVGNLPEVAVLWPSDLNGVPWYCPCPFGPEIRVNTGWGDSRGTLYHEYGHHVLYSHAESPLPDYNNEVCDETNPLAFLPFFGGHCIWREEKGSIHWTEGVPTLFSMAVGESQFPGAWNPLVWEHESGESITTEWPWLSDGSRPSPADEDPAQIEGWTFVLLYDLFDADVDNHDAGTDPHKSADRIQLDFDEIWDAIDVDPDPGDPDHDHPVTIREFHDTLVATYPGLENRINSVYTENLIAYRGADLSVSGVRTSDGVTAVDRGGDVVVEATTHNSAGARTGTDVVTDTAFELVDEATGTAHLLGEVAVAVLAPGGAEFGSRRVTVPWPTPPGDYRLRACADAAGVVFETGDPGTPFTDMADNCADGALITVRNAAPVADAGGPYEFDEGRNPLSGAGSYDPEGDPLTYFWETDAGAIVPADAAEPEIRGLDDGVHTVRLTVSDGWDSSQDTAEVTIHNLAPVTRFFDGADVVDTVHVDEDEGGTVVLSVVAFEPGPDALTATVDWGDGTTDDLGTVLNRTTFTPDHAYGDEGDYIGHVCVTDDDSATHCAEFTVAVSNVDPVLGVDPIVLTGTEGSSIMTSVPFTDPGDDSWTADIDYGDGMTPTGIPLPGRSVGLGHVYAQDGSYTGSVCVDDGDGGSDCAVLSATIANVAPGVGPVVVDDPVIALVEADLLVGFTDPGALDLHTATITWGDGSSDDPAALSEPAGATPGSVSGSHTFGAAADSVEIEVCVADEADTTCESAFVDVLSPAEALAGVIADFEGSADPAVVDALHELAGTPSGPPGALERLEGGDLVAALTKIGKAIDDLSGAATDRTDEIRVLVLLAESIAREQYASAAALGLTARGDLMKLATVALAIADGRAAFEDGRYADAVDAYKIAVQKATTLI